MRQHITEFGDDGMVFGVGAIVVASHGVSPHALVRGPDRSTTCLAFVCFSSLSFMSQRMIGGPSAHHV
jgi:hypothetical protein